MRCRPLTLSGLLAGLLEDVYSFTCQATGTVTLDISGMDCDLDVYVLDDRCDPYKYCEEGITQSSTADTTLSFSCTAGDTYYVVVEGYGLSLSSSDPGYCDASAGDGSYTISFDADSTSGCHEDCDDGIDNDCDGSVDEGVSTDRTWYLDSDGDGYGDASSTTTACAQPSGYVAYSTDCDDADATISPGADELCDTIDNDCDGDTDERDSTDADTWYLDADGDGYGDLKSTTTSCSAPSGYASSPEDCDDDDASIYPGADEYCDEVDTDFDGVEDESEALDALTWYADTDGDGYGDPLVTDTACEAASGWVSDDSDCDDGVAEVGGDCDDGDAGIAPGTPETCDGVDQDCDGTLDEGTECRDDDSDGYTELGGDCDDTDPTIGPHVAEVEGNGVDDDCDGDVDGGSYDGDGDGFSAAGGDCDDTDASVSPGAHEVEGDGVDNDWDGEAL